MSTLPDLANLLHRRNAIDDEIAGIINRPAHPGHIAEYIAAEVFGVDLHPAASTKAHNGFFREGPLTGRSVNIKYGSRRDGMLNLSESLDWADHAEYYLVLTGPTTGAGSSVGLTTPWVIHAVYMFESRDLLEYLASKKRRPGIATSLRKELWRAGMIYPEPNSNLLQLTIEQERLLELFRGQP